MHRRLETERGKYGMLVFRINKTRFCLCTYYEVDTYPDVKNILEAAKILFFSKMLWEAFLF